MFGAFMSDNLFNSLQKLFENNERRFNAPLREFEHDDQDGGDRDEEVDAPEGASPAEELPIESHPSVFPQPAASKGIIYLNPLAIPNDYSKGHVVCVLKVDKADKKVRVDSLKNGVVHVPFSIIKKDESGREYVTKEDVANAYTRGSFVYSLLKLQPAKLDRHAKIDKLGQKDADAKRVGAVNPNVTDVAGDVKGDKRTQDNLRRKLDRGEDKGLNRHAGMLSHGKDLDTGVSDVDRAKAAPEAGTPEYYADINQKRKENGLPPLPQSMWKLKK
jgi:hypothetical protein